MFDDHCVLVFRDEAFRIVRYVPDRKLVTLANDRRIIVVDLSAIRWDLYCDEANRLIFSQEDC